MILITNKEVLSHIGNKVTVAHFKGGCPPPSWEGSGMSSMVALWRLATMWVLLRATLPTEVVIVSRWVTPVAVSYTIVP